MQIFLVLTYVTNDAFEDVEAPEGARFFWELTPPLKWAAPRRLPGLSAPLVLSPEAHP